MQITLNMTHNFWTTMTFQEDGSVRFTELDIGDSMEDHTESFAVADAVEFFAALLHDRFAGTGHDLYGRSDAWAVVDFCELRGFTVVEHAEVDGAELVLERRSPSVYRLDGRVFVKDRTFGAADEPDPERPWFELPSWRSLAGQIVEDRCAGPNPFGLARQLVDRCQPPDGWSDRAPS